MSFWAPRNVAIMLRIVLVSVIVLLVQFFQQEDEQETALSIEIQTQ